MAELFVVNGICGGTVFFLPDVPTVVGRSPECHVQVGDPWISSMHALFERRGDELWVVDLDSRNGTWLDGERIHEARVQAGAKLRFGRTSAEVREPSPEAAAAPSILSDRRTVIRYIADLASPPEEPRGPAAVPRLPLAAEPGPSRDTVRGPAGVTGAARRQVGVLNEVGRALLGATGLEDALGRLLRVLAASVGAEGSSVLLMDERGEMVPVLAVPTDRPPRISATVVQATLRSRAGILTLDAQQDLRFAQSESIIAQGIHSCICAPIWADNRVLGVLLLERGFVDPFTADDLELATLVGFQAALAVERERIADRARAAEHVRQTLLQHLDAATAAAVLAAEPDAEPLAPALRDAVRVVAVAVDGIDALAAAVAPAEAARRASALQGALSDAALSDGAAVERRLDGG
ncbi:MAG TPA: FHA domain-containing protein, partial [Anaeromyxobacteraceae bacterium]|nr:FHA domain-containing protein [Anaeromyxobacteraceae bacterium]